MATQQQLLSLVEAVEKATGYRPHKTTVTRWCILGSRGSKLHSVILGGRRLTTVQDVKDFMAATTAGRESQGEPCAN
jgi:hypothetical protein